MLLSAVYVLVVAQSSSEVPEGLMNNPVRLHKASISNDYDWAQRKHNLNCRIQLLYRVIVLK